MAGYVDEKYMAVVQPLSGLSKSAAKEQIYFPYLIASFLVIHCATSRKSKKDICQATGVDARCAKMS